MADQKESLTREIDGLLRQEQELRAQIQPLTEKLLKVAERRQERQEQLAQHRQGAGELTLETLYAEWRPEETTTASRVLNNLAAQLGFHRSGYWIETEKPAFKFQFYQKRPGQVDAYLAALRRLAPVLKPHPDGTFWFGVFEHTLSERCSYSCQHRDKREPKSSV
jgi:hypothetical protein